MSKPSSPDPIQRRRCDHGQFVVAQRTACDRAHSGLRRLGPYSPDLNPIELAFAKLKELLRKQGARTIEALWQSIGDICALFSPQECWNFFRHDGYASDLI